jgi:hypothetical protein
MLVNRLLNLHGHEQPVQVIPEAEVHGEAFRRRLGALIDHAVGKYHDTDVGFLCPLPLPVFLDEDKGPDQQDDIRLRCLRCSSYGIRIGEVRILSPTPAMIIVGVRPSPPVI